MSANGHYPATITQIQIRTPTSATILLKLDVAAGELAMRGLEAFNAVRHAKQRGVPVRVGSRVVCTLCRSVKGEGEGEGVGWVDRVGGFVVGGGGEGDGDGGLDGGGDREGVGAGNMDGDGEGNMDGGNGDGVEEGVDGDVEGGDGDQSGDRDGDGDGDGGWWWRRWVRRNAVVGWHMRRLV